MGMGREWKPESHSRTPLVLTYCLLETGGSALIGDWEITDRWQVLERPPMILVNSPQRGPEAESLVGSGVKPLKLKKV